MSKIEKLIQKFLNNPKDLTWDELIKILNYYGFEELKTGKTGGSARKFENKNGIPINIHKPHPKNIVKEYVIKLIINALKEEKLL